jgi:hypothetical protein
LSRGGGLICTRGWETTNECGNEVTGVKRKGAAFPNAIVFSMEVASLLDLRIGLLTYQIALEDCGQCHSRAWAVVTSKMSS